MTNLPTSGGAWTRDDKGALARAEAAPAPKPAAEPKPARKETGK